MVGRSCRNRDSLAADPRDEERTRIDTPCMAFLQLSVAGRFFIAIVFNSGWTGSSLKPWRVRFKKGSLWEISI